LQTGNGDYAMVGFVLRNTLSEFGTVARGVCRVSGDGFLEQVVELTSIARDGDHAKNTDGDGKVTELTGDEAVSMNMFGFTPEVFGQLKDQFKKFLEANGSDLKKECFIPSTVNELLVAGQAKVKVLRSNDSWFGVTYREDHAQVVESIRQLIQKGVYPESLWA
jgi:NDP-sugar pyrophosphorylase family protein